MYICISLRRGAAQLDPFVYMTHARTGVRSRRFSWNAWQRSEMCLSCSFEAVPYDSLVDMLFFLLPLGAKNNLAVPLNPALKIIFVGNAKTSHAAASAEDDFSSSGTIHTLSRPVHSCTSSTWFSRAQARLFDNPAQLRSLKIIQKHLFDVSEPKAASPQ